MSSNAELAKQALSVRRKQIAFVRSLDTFVSSAVKLEWLPNYFPIELIKLIGGYHVLYGRFRARAQEFGMN